MRKIYLCFLLLFTAGSLLKVKGQLNYSFSASSGMFSAINGTSPVLTTTVYDGGSGADEAYANSIPIGFTFKYNGTDYTTLGVSTNGFIYLGGSFTASSTFYANNLATGFATSRPIIAPLWDDLDVQSAANIQYRTSGAAGSLVFTIQWVDVKWNYNSAAAISFQVKLYQGSNKIDFIYSQLPGPLNSPTASIGITGTGTGSGNFVSLQNASAAPTTSTTLETTAISTKPATNQVYTFTPPVAPSVDAGIAGFSAPVGCVSSVIVVTLKNFGLTDIAAGAATVALKIGGVNSQGPLTASNTALIATGQTGTVTFTPSFPVPGTNLDTVYIQSLAGDVNKANDTLKSGHITAPAPVTAPFVQDFEGSAPGWTVASLAGTQNWGLGTAVSYPDMTPPFTLQPKSGTGLALFSSYSFTPGTISRLTSNCITIPASGNTGCGYAMGFYYTHDGEYSDPDSLVIRVNTPAGLSVKLGKLVRFDTSLLNISGNHLSAARWAYYSFDVSSYAGQTVNFSFDAYGDFGNNMAIDSFFVNARSALPNVALAGSSTNGVSLVPAATACDVSGWTYYKEPGNAARYLFAIQWDPSSTGANALAKSNATVSLQNDVIYSDTVDVVAKKGTFTMRRYWNVQLNGATMTAPVNVRFFYSQYEKDSITNAAAAFAAQVAGTIEPATWFKTIGRQFVPNASNLSQDGVTGATSPLTDVNQAAGASINGQLYAQFNGIGDFSGGTYATGVGPGTPLPVTYAELHGARSGKNITLSWATKTEQNNKGFEIERSADSYSFSNIGFAASKAASGTSVGQLQYGFDDLSALSGSNYYRLKQIDKDGKFAYSNVVFIKGIKPTTLTLSNLYPNPAQQKINAAIESPFAGNVTLVVSDMTGKVLTQKAAAIVMGDNIIPIDVARLPAGTYTIKMLCDNGCDAAVRKFNKR